MNANTGDILPQYQKTQIQEGLDMETQVDANGATTYHHVTSDGITGTVTEHVYDSQRRLIRILKRAPGGSTHQVHYDPASGRPTITAEASTMTDGNLYRREVLHNGPDQSSEVVSIISPSGLLLRLTERVWRGSLAVFLGETQYNEDGSPARTLNQHLCAESGRLTHREEIAWYMEGRRAMTEHHYFDDPGRTIRYIKVLHHADGGPFSEEIQDFDPETGALKRRELLAFTADGYQTCWDVLYYGQDGTVHERKSTFFNKLGQPIGWRTTDDLDQAIA